MNREKMMRNIGLIVGLGLFTTSAWAAVVPEYATNQYTDHILSRAEKKCLDEGYKITYANCDNQTAPADRCPHHDSYYRSCSQEQWCRNNNFTFLPKDCLLPAYPVKICDNKFEIYRVCQKDTVKACREQGYSSITECQLSDQRCEYDNTYGKCCDDCPDYPYPLGNVPYGYTSNGETCTTCDGVVKTKVVEASCEGFEDCKYGPTSHHTPACRQGDKTLYSSCKTAQAVCHEQGYLLSSCEDTEDGIPCPEDAGLQKCQINCYKYALHTFSDSDIIAQNARNPELDPDKSSVMSLYGEITPDCVGTQIPTVTIDLNQNTFPIYRELFNRRISNVNFIINFEEPLTLELNGELKNVKILSQGSPKDCAFAGKQFTAGGKVSFGGTANVCADAVISDMTKLTISGDLNGNVSAASNTSLGIRGNLTGRLVMKSYSEAFIKGQLFYKNKQPNSPDAEGIVFGCNSRIKVVEGITAEAANILIKQYSIIDTPFIKLVSTGSSDSGTAALHLHKYGKITSVLGDSEYGLAENAESSGNIVCDDKFVTHQTSSFNDSEKEIVLNPADTWDTRWQCGQLSRLQMKCN